MKTEEFKSCKRLNGSHKHPAALESDLWTIVLSWFLPFKTFCFDAESYLKIYLPPTPLGSIRIIVDPLQRVRLDPAGILKS